MTRKLVGKVSPEEAREIQSLFERRNALKELFVSIPSAKSDLYEKVVSDMGKTSQAFQAWWDAMAQKYEWEGCDGGSWSINFDTCEIFLENI